MTLCSDDHEEICYESRYCPLCSLREELQDTIKELKEENAKLGTDCEEMQAQLDAE